MDLIILGESAKGTWILVNEDLGRNGAYVHIQDLHVAVLLRSKTGNNGDHEDASSNS